MALAARGSRKTGEQVEDIEDDAILAQVRRQARQVYLKALLVAVPLTVLAVLIP